MPPATLEHLRQGGFTASVRGVHTHSQAIDEVHESVVNKQTKAVLNHTDEGYIEHIAHYLPFRATLTENLRKQVFFQSHKQIMRLLPLLVDMLGPSLQ